jgi:hypothetical protein
VAFVIEPIALADYGEHCSHRLDQNKL